MTPKSTATSSRGGALAPVLTLLFVASLVYLAATGQRPPAVEGSNATDAPAAEFSTARARAHLETLARSPHPTGTDANAEARAYLLGQLSALGLDAQVQEATAVNRDTSAPTHAGTVRNVVARLAGAGATGRALLFAAHYDTAPNSHGAGDDGAGVAALLETARALRAGPPPRNDVVFLFTDAEEPGSLGARAFTAAHPWARDVAVTFNFEARGSGGPSVMFETSADNEWVVSEFARAVPRPAASSLAYEVYKLLPNDTDMTVFKAAGQTGLNFAFLGDATSYHTRLDKLENLDGRSLRHHGSHALGLARHFGGLDLTRPGARGSAVYFDVFGRFLVRYPQAWVLPLAALVTLLCAAVMVLGVRRRHLRPAALGLGFAASLLGVCAAAAAVTLLCIVVGRLDATFRLMPLGVAYNNDLYVAGCMLLTLALAAAVVVLCGRRVGALNLAAGAALCWLLLLLLTSAALPGVSYLFAWPLLFALLGLGYYFLSAAPDADAPAPALAYVVLTLAAGVAVVLGVQVVYQLFLALPLLTSGLAAALVMLLAVLLAPQLDALTRSTRWLLPGLLLVAVVGCAATGLLTARFDPAHPRPDSVFYGLDSDTGRASWVSIDDAPDAWTRQFFQSAVERGPVPAFLPQVPLDFMHSPAPAAPLPPPVATVLEDKTENGLRTLRLRLASARRAALLSVYVGPQAQVVASAVNGQAVSDQNTPPDTELGWGLNYFAPPAEGIELTLTTRTTQPLRLHLVDSTYGLPQQDGVSYQPRPDDVMPNLLPVTDSTFVSKTFQF
ncbi:MAG TPA: M20/M25/M40 family metallo-hydrolase [Pyrinomonadaceae bacterium]